MLPRLLLITIFGISALATKPEISEDKDTKKKITHLDYKYGYSLPGSNSAYQGHAEYRTGKEISGNFVVQLPEGQSISDVQYTADDNGFHPVVRITTKGNNSQVTSHFALGESAVNRLNQQQNESPKNQSTILGDSISKVLATLFPDGIPGATQNLTKETISTEWNDGVELVPTTAAPLIPFQNITKSISIENVDSTHIVTFNDSTNVAHIENQNKELFPDFDFDTVPKPKKEKTQENDKKVSADLEFSKDLPDLVQNLVSGDDLVRINEAAEEYIMNERKRQPFLPTTVRPFQTRLESNSVDGSHQYYDELFPFENPIVVDEIFDDNIIAFSQDNNNMRFALPPPAEVQILPSRENFVNIENVESEPQINVQIIQDKENEGKSFEKPIFKSEDSQDLDPFQKSVEENFSKGYAKAEAPSRIFLRKFNENLLKKVDTVTNSRGRSLELSNSSINTFNNESDDDSSSSSQLTSDVFLAPIHIGVNVSSSNSNTVDSSNATTARPRGKTFVEIQKAINIQNLLIKEDGESIERHEEFLQPLANNGAYTHIIDSKFMKDRPQRYGDNQLLSQNFASTENPVQQFSLETQQFLESHFQTNKNSGQKVSASTSEEQVLQNSIPDYYSQKYQGHNLQKELQQYHQDQLEQQELLNQQHEIQQHEQQRQQITDELIKSLEYSFPQDQHSKSTNIEIHKEEITNENSDIQQQQQQQNNENLFSYQQQINNENSFNHQQQISTYTQQHHQQTPPQHYQSEKIVEKIVERPIEKIVEKEVRIPYPVKEYIEKIVEKPIEIQKFIDRPIPVPYPVPFDRIINRPYPVEKLVEKPIHVPYPVEKIVEKIIDRPVEVEKIVVKKVPVPVEKIVEKFVDRPVPVEVQKFIDRPYPVEKIVEKIVDRPVPVHVPIQVPIQVPVQVPFPSHITYSTLNHLAPPAFNNGHQQHLSNNHALNLNQNGYQIAILGNLPSYRDPYSIFQQQQQQHHIQQLHQQHLIQQQHHQQQQNQQQQQQQNNNHNHQQQLHQQSQQHPLHILQNPVQNPCIQFKHLCRPYSHQTMRYAKKYTYKDNAMQNHIKDDYLGPVPVENGCSHWGTGCQFKRSSDFGRNLRMEYGFKPPLIPSIEIDDQGLPINRKSRR